MGTTVATSESLHKINGTGERKTQHQGGKNYQALQGETHQKVEIKGPKKSGPKTYIKKNRVPVAERKHQKTLVRAQPNGLQKRENNNTLSDAVVLFRKNCSAQ